MKRSTVYAKLAKICWFLHLNKLGDDFFDAGFELYQMGE